MHQCQLHLFTKELFIGYFYGFITPGGFGAYLCAIYLKMKARTPLRNASRNIITYNTIDYITIFMLRGNWRVVPSRTIPVSFPAYLLLLFGMSFSLFFYLRQKHQKSLPEASAHTNLRIHYNSMLRILSNRSTKTSPASKSLILPFLVSFLSWVVFYTVLYFIAGLFDIHIPYVTFIFMLAITSSIAIIPISVYGLGTRDAVLVALFSFYDIPPENSISFTLFWFTLFLITPSIIGAFVTVFETRKLPSKKILIKQ